MQKDSIFIEITTTNNCNCHCSYCFEGDSTRQCEKRNIEVENRQIELLKKACEEFDMSKYKWLSISFWGGEPFLNTEFLFKIISETFSYPFVRYHFYSNGTLYDKFAELLNQDWFDYIRSRILVQLSYDGQPIHQIKRGSDENIIFNVANLLLSNKVDFSFKATLTYDMIPNLSKIWDSYYQLFLRFGNVVQYYPTLDSTSLDESYLEQWKEQLQEIAKKEYNFMLKYNRFLFGWFDSGRKASCRLDNSIHLHTDGNMYICHGCPYKKEKDKLSYGNIFNVDSLESVLIKDINNQLLPESCLTCPSTYCSYCHIDYINNVDEIKTSWNKCRVNSIRCQYYKYFGYISKLLKYSLVDKMYWK